jgi:hypothetical protein
VGEVQTRADADLKGHTSRWRNRPFTIGREPTIELDPENETVG